MADTPTPAPARPSFHEDFYARAQQFANDIIVMVPELEAVAIVPSWEIQQQELPFGVIKGRNGPIQTPQEVLHMAEQLHGALRHVSLQSFQILKAVDNQLGAMAAAVQEKEERLRELDRQLAEREQQVSQIGQGDGGTAGRPAE